MYHKHVASTAVALVVSAAMILPFRPLVPVARADCVPDAGGTCNCTERRGEVFLPQNESWYPAGLVPVDGYWKTKNKELKIRVKDDATGTVLQKITIWSSSVSEPQPCPVPPCMSSVNRYRFQGSVYLTPGRYRIRVHKSGNKCLFAKPIDQTCFDSEFAATGNYCTATDDCRESVEAPRVNVY